MSERPDWGARIERGKAADVTTEGGRILCSVESLDRPGVRAVRLPCPEGVADGDVVWFFLFEDGTGGVLGAAG